MSEYLMKALAPVMYDVIMRALVDEALNDVYNAV